MNRSELDLWLEDTAWDKSYWADVYERAKELESDGCTGVPDTFVWTCYEHDIHYRTHKTVHNRRLHKWQADHILMVRIQQCAWRPKTVKKPNGKDWAITFPFPWLRTFFYYPWAWIRYIGVTVFPQAYTAWDGNK